MDDALRRLRPIFRFSREEQGLDYGFLMMLSLPSGRKSVLSHDCRTVVVGLSQALLLPHAFAPTSRSHQRIGRQSWETFLFFSVYYSYTNRFCISDRLKQFVATFMRGMRFFLSFFFIFPFLKKSFPVLLGYTFLLFYVKPVHPNVRNHWKQGLHDP